MSKSLTPRTHLTRSRRNRLGEAGPVERLEPRTLLAVTPAGGEMHVNTTTANTQLLPATAMDASGNFVVVWQSRGEDGFNSDGIYAQRYNAAGVAQGGEFLVNTTTSGNQTRPAVAMDAAGAFVVAWESPDTAENGIFFQRYNAAGVKQGGETRANVTIANQQAAAAVAMDGDGDFVVAWQSTGQDVVNTYGVYARRFNAAGVAQGGEFRANTATALNQWYPTVAMDGPGDFVIAWQSMNQDPNGTPGIYAQRYNAAGAAQGGEFRVNTTTTDVQAFPAAAMDADGDFVIAWHSVNQDPNIGVYAQRYNAAGSAQGGEFRVNTTTASTQAYAAVAMDADGDFVVTWQSYSQDAPSTYGIYTQRYTAAGAALDAETRVNTTTAGQQKFPAVAVDAGGDFVVAWSSYGQEAGDFPLQGGIYAQRYAAPRLLNVAQVSAGGTAWAAPFKTYLQGQGIGGQFGFTVGGGAAQSSPLPWNTINQISIAFSGDVQVDQADLAVRGVNVASYPITGFVYDPVSHTATWTLGRTIGNDNLILDLDGDAPNGVHAAGAGGQFVDGDWTTGGTFPSGNGTPGGDFRYRFKVLAGDVTRDGRVNAVDLSDAKRRLNRTPGDGVVTGAYSAFDDVDGGGRINALDLSAIRQRLNQTLPATEPAGTATAELRTA
jgi:hypothetical protein